MKDDTVSRAAVMQSLTREYNRRRTGDGLKLAWIEKAVNEVPEVKTEIIRCKECRHRIVNDHYGERGYLDLKAYCELDSGDPFELSREAENDDWFCADAERGEEHHEAE